MLGEKEQLTSGQIIASIIYLIIGPLLILFLSGDWGWVEGWIFDLGLIIVSVSSFIYLYRHDPALLVERFRKPGSGNQKTWDKYVVYLLAIGFWAWFFIMPLDAKRYEWSPAFPNGLKIFGGLVLLSSFFFLYRSFTDNTFLSPLVRIQSERHQKVVSTGLYGFVRHPMYLGAICLFLGTPMLLGSLYGLLIGVLMSLLLIVRIRGEEQMLVTELEGYEDYKMKVKYKLIPFVW
ncbi:methyltransferase family protein [Gloeothece verrucosa]|uniref:Isoprenylcysteine carboxyl methyltransferase n=1 Tax=Gloeothece verrucosa (strain PCC 7822) TaxID=497965 RepID=E0UHZ0_GLOV7|nr:isoprenylcysteine carboxylmethyltransferase family protein [Gloeothece verrucosa]ADN14520.1 Isoprenylcysteine carboxyl methyltransferase [Gloeothece verrucosa PCC 7822]